MLQKQTLYMTKGMRFLKEYCETYSEEKAEAVIQTENDGDLARRELIDELNESFITPIDREDLFKISAQLDEILDYAKTTVDEVRLYGVRPDKEMTSIVEVLTSMCEHISLAVANMEMRPSISRDEAILVKSMENKVGDMCVRGLAILFDTADYKTIFKYREIYRHLNQTADIADSTMDLLLNILVKMA
jgi:predicted phosphate transport protein (TIGR00153 family)